MKEKVDDVEGVESFGYLTNSGAQYSQSEHCFDEKILWGSEATTLILYILVLYLDSLVLFYDPRR